MMGEENITGELEKCYVYKILLFKVTRRDMHNILQIDPEFFNKIYLAKPAILNCKHKTMCVTAEPEKCNNRKKGGGTIRWRWYEIMKDIFKENRTINKGATLSSMEYPEKMIDNVKQRTNSPIPSTSMCEAKQISSSTNFSSSLDVEITGDQQKINFQLVLSDAIVSRPSLEDIKKQEARRSEALYHMRQKESDYNEKKLGAPDFVFFICVLFIIFY